jgi:hypothetical protein
LPSTSNDAFWWLFPTYLQSEQVFAVNGSAYTTSVPDNRLDANGASARVNTLKAGENTYAYVAGLSDTTNPTFPLLADGFSSTVGTYALSKSQRGGVWAGKKAVVVLCDASGQLMAVDNTTHQVMRTDSNGARVNMFQGTSDGSWIDTAANPVLNPQ